MIRRPPRSTRTDTLFPYTTLFRSDRFFGVISAHVAGPDSADYRFTSALPTQLLRSLAPQLQPLLERAPKAPAVAAPPIAESDDGTVLGQARSEEHTSELQSLMRISYAVFCLKKKNNTHTTITSPHRSYQP